MKKNVLGQRAGTAMAGNKFAVALLTQAPELPATQLWYWIHNQDKLAPALLKALEIPDTLEAWEEFYSEVFGITNVEFSKIRTPAPQDGFNWKIVMLKGVNTNDMWEKYSEFLEVFIRGDYLQDFDELFEDRDTADHYIILARDGSHGDKETGRMSANDCKEKGIQSITFSERLMLGLYIYWRTLTHLDIGFPSICAGSRTPDGKVPCVGCSAGQIKVSYIPPDLRYDHDSITVRAVVV